MKFAKLPTQAITDENLSDFTLRVLAYLCDLANKDGECWPKQGTIADGLKCKRETINRTVKILEEAGYISAQRKRHGIVYKILSIAEKSQSHSVTVESPCDPSITSEESHCDPTLTSHCDPTLTSLYKDEQDLIEQDPIINPPIPLTAVGVDPPGQDSPPAPPAKPKTSNTTPADDPLRLGFEEFWAAYPMQGRKKGAKHPAWLRYRAVCKQAVGLHEKIMEGVRNYAAYLGRSGEYNADARTWLNQRRWEDDYSPPSGSKSPHCGKQTQADKWRESHNHYRRLAELDEQGEGGLARQPGGGVYDAKSLWQGGQPSGVGGGIYDGTIATVFLPPSDCGAERVYANPYRHSSTG